MLVTFIRGTVRLALFVATSAPASAQQTASTAPVVFDGVTVVDVEHGKLLPAQRVVITGRHIQTVGEAAAVKSPKGANVVDARGKYLMPGLWDMHVHPRCFQRIIYPLFVANGVTGIRDAGSDEPLDTLRLWRREIAAGARIGPRLVFAGRSLVNSEYGNMTTCGGREMTVYVATPADAQHVVDSLKAAGADFIKLHLEGGTDREFYFAAAAAVRHTGLAPEGHVPASVSAIEASDSGVRIIDHGLLGEDQGVCASLDECRAVAEHLKRNGTWVTLGAGLMGPPVDDSIIEKYWPAWLTVDGIPIGNDVRYESIIRSGMPILAGTDAGIDLRRYLSGFSLHGHLAALVEQGATPLEALRAATLNPAKYLKGTDSLGTVAAGKLADLVLLDADPLADIHNTTTIRAVVANGRYFDRAALDRVLAEVQARAAAEPER